MSSLYDFLQTRNSTTGFTTEDVLVSFLPLLRQVMESHAKGCVAPLQGLDSMQVEGPRIWFETARQTAVRREPGRLAAILAEARRGVVVVDEHRVELNDDGKSYVNLSVGEPDAEITRPVFLPGYAAWEHAIGHHDPATDVFSLGMILAGLACGFDFYRREDLETFAAHRRNLFHCEPNLHPVLARSIEKMTELDRRDRTTDLASLLTLLENFGQQQVDFQLELDRIQGFHTKDLESKHQIVLSKLQERLFEVSRRNRLLHFRTTMQTVNLTEASVPLSFDYKNIRPEQLLTWNPSFYQDALSGRAIPLDKYLNFEEAIYLPIVLDRIRNEARRDQAEFGFSQLRLVACFLSWTNTKANPQESYHSPLVLLPAALTRKKGVRDTYQLRLLSNEAEVNPVIRHQFKQLYGIDLPEMIDLEETDLQTFHAFLAAQVRASEPAIEISLIDKPRISLLHDKARRRLDQYQRRARVSGRGVRSFHDLDYSYDPANYHPLGLKAFSSYVRPQQARISAIVETDTRSPQFMVEPAGAGDQSGDSPEDTRAKSFFSVKQRTDDNPYHWEFDLCAVTLGNFRYRKMSLVRDYTAVAESSIDNPAFDGIFSLSPRPAPTPVDSPSLEERFHVVPCDPTQTLSIARAKTGDSYIIQGPPGTGKSQTITNLIADYVARGKRVLFVCEKRAAIDVVYLRLRQQGLDELCCLIHDSLQDKKQFVMDLKQTYEGFLHPLVKADPERRGELTRRLARDLEPLQEFRAAMTEPAQGEQVALLEVIERSVALRGVLPELSPLQLEQAPSFGAWREHGDRLAAFDDALREIEPSGVFSNHPLSVLASDLVREDRPMETIANGLRQAGEQLSDIVRQLEQSGVDTQLIDSPARLQQAISLCRRWDPLARHGLLALLDENSAASKQYAEARGQLRSLESRLLETREQTTHWRQKPPRGETADARSLAKRMEGQWWSFLNPSWWRLRGVLTRCYDFSVHTIKPTWTDVLDRLMEEHEADRALQQTERDVAFSFEIRDQPPHEFFQDVERIRAEATEVEPEIEPFAESLVHGVDGARCAAAIRETETALSDFLTACDRFLHQAETRTWEQLLADLQSIESAEDDWPDAIDCLGELDRLPADVASAIRALPLDLRQLEAAAAEKLIESSFRSRREARRFDSAARNRQADRLERIYGQWLEANAREVKRRVAERFRENIRICSLPASQLTPEQKEFKKRYQRGRKALEHEFGKSMRYRSIRDLVSGDSGDVVKDLKPVWLMSPLSVADTVPLDQDHFDVVVFDEASQITLEEAVPTIFRATQAIVVGDEMQLPPTDFFSSKRDEDDVLLLEEDGELIEYDLESNSLLNHAARNLTSTMLGWHYRSRSESLISFSNWSFYKGNLLTVPEEDLPTEIRDELIVQSSDDAGDNIAEINRRPVSFHYLQNGIYEKRRNRAEADYIAQLVRQLLTEEPHLSVGVVAFSEAQQDEIESAMQRLANSDREFADRLERELEREEEDGQFAGLLIKNLENIQGDERDLIIMSVCYGRDRHGKMRMNFGPINRHGGEKRLNVAFSRAKHRMALVSSIRHFDITNDYNDGANCLKRYLLYAERVSMGDIAGAQRLLEEIAGSGRSEAPSSAVGGAVATELGQSLIDRGFQVDTQVGQSQFRCDLAVRRQGDEQYRLGILLDTEQYYDDDDPLEREMMKPKLLRDFGWNVEVILAKDWREHPEEILARLLARLEDGVLGADDSVAGPPPTDAPMKDGRDADERRAEDHEVDISRDQDNVESPGDAGQEDQWSDTEWSDDDETDQPS